MSFRSQILVEETEIGHSLKTYTHSSGRVFSKNAYHSLSGVALSFSLITQDHMEKKLDGNYTRMPREILEQVLEVTPHKAPAVHPLTSHRENYQS